MAHQLDAEAADVPAFESASDKAAEFEKYLADDQDEESTDEGDGDADEADLELDDEEQQDDEADEPETVIEAPVSLNAEEKKVFAQLPPEAQQAWAASETRRNTQVQEATTKASTAQREAETRAAAADAEAKARYAEQLAEVGKAFMPAEPDRAQYRDDTSYLIALHQHQQMTAQHNDFMQQVAVLHQQAGSEADAAFVQQRDRELMQIPEIANPETRTEYLERAFNVATELGFDQSDLAKRVEASDIKALAQIAEWRAKAAKLDSAMSKQMQRVRAGKGRSLRPNAAPHAEARAVAKPDKAWARVKEAGNNKAARDEAFAEYLESAGHL